MDSTEGQITITYLMKDYVVNQELYELIQSLPTHLRHLLYIQTMRLYWRDYIPLTSRVPSWYSHAIQQQQLLFDARYKNIHFLHLPCNTLPQYKQYIIGCQCEFCLYRVHPLEKMKQLQLNKEGFLYFYQSMPYTESEWNDRIEIINYENPIYGLPIFNPNYEEESTANTNKQSTVTFSHFPTDVGENE
jgi:hypothetical protein